MRSYLIGALLLATASVAAAQQPAASPSASDKTDKSASKMVTLSGCVAKGNGQPNQITLDDQQNGKYQLSGNRIGKYLGRRVEVSGTEDTLPLEDQGRSMADAQRRGAGRLDRSGACRNRLAARRRCFRYR
jgi:hypothetical protein